VTDRKYIDKAVALSRLPNVIITTYGDLIRVPGSSSTLDFERSKGSDIRIVYSTFDAIDIAKRYPDKKIIFLGIGFETTTPASAAGIVKARKENITNFFILSAHKVMPPAMTALITEGVKINGYICPGHVSVITGSGIYNDIAGQFKLGCVISGFEPIDILQSIYMLVKQIENKKPAVEIQYSRVVQPEGNRKAQLLIQDFFEPCDDWWRGFGIIPKSGMAIRKKYEEYDADKNFIVNVEETKEPKGCICGEILKGLQKPFDCMLFGKACTPSDPVGACMVSSEGSCAAYYQYRKMDGGFK
jgi:hydrogenase expression/formation protein HypD